MSSDFADLGAVGCRPGGFACHCPLLVCCGQCLRIFRFSKIEGLVTWRQSDGAQTMVANVDEYLPGAVDGWTYAVDLITEAVRDRTPARFVTALGDVGTVFA